LLDKFFLTGFLKRTFFFFAFFCSSARSCIIVLVIYSQLMSVNMLFCFSSDSIFWEASYKDYSSVPFESFLLTPWMFTYFIEFFLESTSWDIARSSWSDLTTHELEIALPTIFFWLSGDLLYWLRLLTSL
jgi:hypothetical protein